MSLPVDSNSPSDIPPWQRRGAGPVVITVTFIALLVWTWQRLIDVLVDFGVQLYVPWQLAEGKVPYRDIAHYTGPFSIYYCALAFRIFGVNLRVLELANLPILIATVIAIYYLANRLGGRLCATICCISFLILFAFARISVAGNYNFVTPYEYEYTHATLFCLGVVIFLNRLLTRRKIADAAIAGFLAGMIFLTRAEFFAAAIAAAIAGFTFLTAASPRSCLKFLAIFFIAMLFPPIASICLLHLAMPWSLAIHGTLGMWPALLRGNVSAQHFYQHSMGLDDLPKSLHLLFVWLAAWSIPIAAFLAWAIRPKPNRTALALAIAFFLGAIFAGWHWRYVDWISMFRPLPLVALAVIVISIIQYLRKRAGIENASLAAMLGVLSLVLLCKVFLYARIVHYGCWLAMPAAMLLIISLFGWIPTAIARRGGCGTAFSAGIGGAWLVVLLVHLVISHESMKKLSVSVGKGPDQFWADAQRGNAVNNAVLAAGQIPPGKTLDCFPEGIMINYLSRRQASTPYVNFNPPDLLLFGEDDMLRAMNNSPPDFVFLVHKDTSEFGEKFFGRDYGQKLYSWIDANYQEASLPDLDLGSEPLRDAHFGIRLLVPRSRIQPQRRLVQGAGGTMRTSEAAASISSRE